MLNTEGMYLQQYLIRKIIWLNLCCSKIYPRGPQPEEHTKRHEWTGDFYTDWIQPMFLAERLAQLCI